MKISGDKPYVVQAYVKKTGEKETVEEGRKADKHPSGLDRVEISKEAREKEFKEIRELVDKVPDVREEEVAALKTAIEEGNYHVKGEEIARKMIKESIDEFV